MKQAELRQEIKDYILSEVQVSVMRLGINAQLMFVTDKDYRGNEYIKIESSKFQTMPMMFKEIWIEGRVTVIDSEDEGKQEVSISLEYHWQSFRGGSNGTDIGYIYFEVEKDLPEKIKEDSARFYVRKMKGLEI